MAALTLTLASVQSATAFATPMEEYQPPDRRSEILLIDQIVVHGSLTSAMLKELEPAHSMDAVIIIFRRKSVTFERHDIRVATKDMPRNLVEAVLALPAGEPFILPSGGDSAGNATVNLVKERVPAD